MHQCYRFWCFERNFWCLMFWQHIWCWLSCCFFPQILYPFRMKIVRLIIFKFLSSISHSHECFVIGPNWRSSLPSIGNNITRYTYNRFFHLMTILRSVSDSAWVIALCWVLVQNCHQIVLNRGAYVCVGGLGILKFDKNSTDLKCFIFQFGGLGVLFGGLSPPKTPMATRLYW